MLEKSIQAIHTAADMVILGKRKFEAAMTAYPYFPHAWELHEFNQKIMTETDMQQLPAAHQKQIQAGWHRIVNQMQQRAELQTRQLGIGERQVKNNYQEKIFEITEGEVNLNPAFFSLSWGLLCMALVVDRREFIKIKRDLLGDNTSLGSYGFVSPGFENELGPIAVVRRGDEERKTIKHEDIHVLTMLIGTEGHGSALIQEVVRGHIQRAIDDKAQPKDAQRCLESVRRMRQSAKQVISGEFPAILWERVSPDSSLLSDENILQTMGVGVQATIYASYSANSGLSDLEKIRTTFSALKCGDDLNCYCYSLQAVTKQAVENYRGPFNKWEWAGSRMVVMKSGLPVKAYAKALGVEMREIKPDYTGNPAGCLAEALANHVVMQMGLGEDGLDEKRVDYVSRLGQLFRQKDLYSGIIRENSIDPEHFGKELIRRASEKISLHLRPETIRLLECGLT